MARSFNGTSDKIVATLSSSNPAQLTAAAWVKPLGLTPTYGAVIQGQDQISNTSGFSIYVKSTGKLAMYFNHANNSYDGTGTNTLSVGTWYHTLFLGTSGTNVTGYVNGSLDGTANAAYSNTSPSGFGGPFNIGFDGSTNFGNVVVADVAVWSNILSSGEIAALAGGARPYQIRPSLLMGYFPLDGLQSPEPDLSGNNANGTVTGTALASGPPVMMFTPRWPMFTPVFTPAFNLMPQIVT